MAVNMAHMGAGGAQKQSRMGNSQLMGVVYHQLASTTGPTLPWHSQIIIQTRVGHVMNIITNTSLATPGSDSNQVVAMGLQYERDAYNGSPDKATYDKRIQARINELFAIRQANEHNLQNTLSAQAAAQHQAQSQAQMIANQQNIKMRMGQPPQQGFQNLPQHMQPSQIRQPGQPGMPMGTPNGFMMNPNQQSLQQQMGGQMQPQVPMQSPMANLSQQDRMRMTQLAINKFQSIPLAQRDQMRNMVQSKMSPQQLNQLLQQKQDPLMFFLQNQIANSTKQSQAAMAMQGQPQRQMAHAGQQMPNGANGEYGQFSNVESIMNQQKAGFQAQQEGQTVVPASSSAGRTATPQPVGSLPGTTQAPGQTGLPHQMPQHFNHQPAQQLKMDQRAADQRAAQTQAQIRAQAHAKQQMQQGQPGGFNGVGVSQSPGMSTLNAPVRRPPMGLGQAEQHPQMGPANGPFGNQMLDPRFNQMGQRPGMGGNGMNRNQLLQAMVSQLPPETRNQILSQPADKLNAMLMQWIQSKKAGQMAGRPQPQLGQPAPGNPMNQFNPGMNNVGQQATSGLPMNQPNQQSFQQQLNNRLNNPNAPQGMDQRVLMDNMLIPARVLESLKPHVPQGELLPELKKWGHLRQWITSKNLNPQMVQSLFSFQALQFNSILSKNPSLGNGALPGTQPNVPQPGANQPGVTAPNMAGLNPNTVITPEELAHLRNHEKFRGMSDEQIRQVAARIKMQQRAKAQAGQGQVPPQGTPASQPANAMPTATSQVGNGANGTQRQQNTATDDATANSAGPGRSNKQTQNGRAVTNTPMGSAQKSGTKRPSTDEVVEIPNPATTTAQRPPSQQQNKVPIGATAPQIPHFTAQQLANMAPEQRMKYEAMMKSRQPPGAASAAAAAASNTPEMVQLRAIGQEQHLASAQEQLPDIPMTPKQYEDVKQRILSLVAEMSKLSKVLGRWYTYTRDDGRARLFFKMRLHLLKQFVNSSDLTVLKPTLSISAPGLDEMKSMLESMAKDVAKLKKDQDQQNATAPQVAPTQSAISTGQPAPLSAANLEKNTQALNKAHQRNSSKAGQPPAAPTTAQPPFSFGAQSPNGHPIYVGQPTVTQDNLHLPARKRAKIGNQTGSSSNGPSANASPQVSKLTSPEMIKRSASADSKQARKFPCTEPNCEFNSIGFATEEARCKHMDEEHIWPAEDPQKFAAENLAKVLGLDADDKSKKSQPSNPQSQAAAGRPEPASTARGTPMGRQESGPGSKSHEVLKSVALKTGTPKQDPVQKSSDNTAPAGGGMLTAGSKIEANGATIDPHDLFTVGGVEIGGGGAISDMSVYRAITPRDTPESSKDSAASEAISDLSDGVALNVNVSIDMGFDTWHPFDGHRFHDAAQSKAEPGIFDDMSGTYLDLNWDEVHIDFDKPFVLDTSMFSMDIAEC
ncbi:hypothetical protein GGR57DRAFT_30452 [Xylariaceae sp. FL1272]|nr:hypothetical protein GGR57DRAFT_30452 [Xylariaceae sp. FL1272]